MADVYFDVVVVGAGIHGAGVAQAAAARGYSVLVLEQHAPAYGTSSRSSKLIHGGLRYLESGQFSLVRECLRERELLLRLAPDLVRLVPFYIPIYRNTTRRPWQIRAGLSVYALLGGLGPHVRFSRIPRQHWHELSGLNTTDLQAVYRYFDAQTDDAALTRAVLASAQQLGAQLCMPAEFISAAHNATACTVRYQHAGQVQECISRVLVNAAGPWTTQILERISPALQHPKVDLVQGTHIIIDATPPSGIYYVEAPQDRRAVFVMPWKNRTMIGTTEHLYQGDPAQVKPLPEEIDYLLQTYRDYFPATKNPGIHASFAGLRVLPHASKSAFHRPRDTLLLCDNNEHPRVVSIIGGKLTAYRATADRLMQRVASSLPPAQPKAETKNLPLTA